ncbi:MAG TPA: ABC transporter ATP-binding protein [Algoriphagus sp.]|jgi:ATP-binding cassette subfamily F protein 3|uniref:ABC-F family ATP-binding cassette domain-containing protein n=1 Tax=unclassified Algoriphagus TaxID=2641541 RepID=UPI000C4422AE|nr:MULTISPECIES: ABC-F family ATP-binding cassette domain-containing protein [unclassified Algoriphagus]MAL13434.1 ABC transporter ATP-binding protein [Algoriphagus sp.]MAN88004.1 ABC transporter ATP-binding protein [Algoriphagus sp.]HAS58967.1 ABC transporter ATP-binding protein [Algoriphagus sp.]HCD88368.1 ABC transporter ATP-binding protein [Algoriphagus sp.]HCH46050.1 ABC transporter ATP-binding protein [Algoriphagus sp.]
MLSISNLSYFIGGRALYENANLHIKPKDKIGLVGQNGTGKSTLLKIISGDYQPSSGEVQKAKDCTIGFLNQDLLSYQSDESILNVALAAFKETLALQDEIDEVLKKMETDHSEEIINRLAFLQDRFEANEGYTIKAKAEEVLEGIGFKTEDLEKPLRTFSGGWRMRVMLAKLLLEKPSLLMLDEPTNHLDLPSIQWVENYLKTYEGAVIVVSHDQTFLDNCISTTVEVANQTLTTYAGNYSFYKEEKKERMEIQQNAYENQQQMIKQTERFIERFRAKASKSNQVQSRVKALDRMERVHEVVDDEAFVNFKFKFSQKSGRDVVVLDHVSKSYGDLTILKNTSARIERGDKIALIGANGKGKSTLLRIIDGTEKIQGERTEGYNVIKSFFAQHQLEALTLDNEIIQEMSQAGSAKTETELRNVLGCFLFTNEEVFKKIKVLSGGEKSRVALAKTLISEANFLLLDEPTNHLDFQSVNILIQALQQYEGTFITVSHDRHFIKGVANKIWYIEDNQIKEYPGTYEEYEFWKSQQVKEEGTNQAQEKAVKKEQKKTVNPQDPEVQQAKKNLKKLENQLESVEKEVEKLEGNLATVEKELADPELYNDDEKAAKVQDKYQSVKGQLDQKNAEWEELVDEISKLQETLS